MQVLNTMCKALSMKSTPPEAKPRLVRVFSMAAALALGTEGEEAGGLNYLLKDQRSEPSCLNGVLEAAQELLAAEEQHPLAARLLMEALWRCSTEHVGAADEGISGSPAWVQQLATALYAQLPTEDAGSRPAAGGNAAAAVPALKAAAAALQLQRQAASCLKTQS